MKIGVSIAAVLIVLLFVFWKDINNIVAPEGTVRGKDKKEKGGGSDEPSANIVIRKQWDLPEELKEVSGIAYLSDSRFACVQDELGSIFIFNTASGKIEKQIDFAGAGDYEGITVNGKMVYVVRADGQLFEMNMDEGRKSVKEYRTHLTVEQNVEGLCYDAMNNRLLLAIKGNEPGNKNYKGVYAFDLSSKKLNDQPVFKIALNNSIFNETNSKKNKFIMPSEIAIHPVNGEVYITDGPQAKLLIMDQQGNMKSLYKLGKKFSQPEGITFSPGGDLFISNEGTKEPGNIIQVTIND